MTSPTIPGPKAAGSDIDKPAELNQFFARGHATTGHFGSTPRTTTSPPVAVARHTGNTARVRLHDSREISDTGQLNKLDIRELQRSGPPCTRELHSHHIRFAQTRRRRPANGRGETPDSIPPRAVTLLVTRVFPVPEISSESASGHHRQSLLL